MKKKNKSSLKAEEDRFEIMWNRMPIQFPSTKELCFHAYLHGAIDVMKKDVRRIKGRVKKHEQANTKK
jgi:hypothetical protein